MFNIPACSRLWLGPGYSCSRCGGHDGLRVILRRWPCAVSNSLAWGWAEGQWPGLDESPGLGFILPVCPHGSHFWGKSDLGLMEGSTWALDTHCSHMPGKRGPWVGGLCPVKQQSWWGCSPGLKAAGLESVSRPGSRGGLTGGSL